jgi:hypothetical protein
MDAKAQAALMVKASKVFASDDTFLSFPVSPLPFRPQELELGPGKTADEARRNAQNLQAFSTLVNLVPDDEAWLPAEAVFLWDVYGSILRTAQFAQSSRTPAEEEAYQRALAVLQVTAADGSRGDTPAMQAYRQHKDAWLLAQQRYLAAKSTAETQSDAAARAAWYAREEPALRDELDTLQAAWILAGHKNAVESAQALVAQLGARSPMASWAEWNERFNPDLDSRTGAHDNAMVYPSFFAPDNALDDAAWMPFRLSQDEMAALLREAPAELADRLGGLQGAAGIASMAFEFSSAVVVRPWFAPELLRARCWRFGEAQRVISDGAVPPHGELPAYVTAMVFARKVSVTMAPAAPPSDGRFGGFRFLVAVRDAQLRETVRVQPERGNAAFAHALAAGGVQREFAAARAPDVAAVAAPPAVPAPAAASAALVRWQGRTLNLRRKRGFRRVERARSPQFLGIEALRVEGVGASPAPAPTAPPAPAAPSPLPDDAIYVLAFICKRVPRCPDPDPALAW